MIWKNNSREMENETNKLNESKPCSKLWNSKSKTWQLISVIRLFALKFVHWKRMVWRNQSIGICPKHKNVDSEMILEKEPNNRFIVLWTTTLNLKCLQMRWESLGRDWIHILRNDSIKLTLNLDYGLPRCWHQRHWNRLHTPWDALVLVHGNRLSSPMFGLSNVTAMNNRLQSNRNRNGQINTQCYKINK